MTDTIDAVYRPEDWTPESLLDQLAEMVTDLPEVKVSPKPHGYSSELMTLSQPGDVKVKETRVISYAGEGDLPPGTNLRRPMLGYVKQIGSIRDLLPFFSQVSMSSYESVYGMGTVDWDIVEKGLMAEMFQGGGDEVDSST